MGAKLLLKILLPGMLVILILIMSSSLAKGEQELKSELLKLNDVKEEISAAGMSVSRVSDLITEGFLYFNNYDYNNTRRIISSVYELRSLAFETQKELAAVNQLYLDVVAKNISLADTGSSSAKLELDLEYAEKEFAKENYEEAWNKLAATKKTLLISIDNTYGYLNNSLATLEEKITSLEMSKARITTLRTLLSEALEKGMLGELELIKQEAEALNQSLEYYEEIKLIIPALESMNLSSQRIRDELRAAELELNLADYNSGLSRLESLKKLTENALRLEEEINGFEKTLNDEGAKYSADFKEAEALLEKAKYALAAGNYEEAAQRLTSAKSVFETTKAELLVRKAGLKSQGASLKDFVSRNWTYILLVIFVILIVLKLTHKAWAYELRRKRLGWFEKELRASEKIVQELQRKYFVHRKMSRESYDKYYEELQEKILGLKEKTSLLNKKIKKEEKHPLK